MRKKREIEESALLWANSADSIKMRIAAIADTTENERIELDAVLNVGKTHGMFIDRSQVETSDKGTQDEINRRAAELALKMLTDAGKVSDNASQSLEDAITRTNAVKVVSDNGETKVEDGKQLSPAAGERA